MLAISSAAPAAAESAGGLSWTAPKGWTAQQRPMRAANYVVPAAGGDSEAGECAVYYFGAGQGGGVDANIERWISQFRAPDGGSAKSLAKRSEKTVHGLKVSMLDLTGTYLFKPFPMAPQATPKPGYRMLAAIVPGPDAPIFFKLTAPKKTADAAEAAFLAMIESIHKP
ncbi:MAG: hypothetical protein GC160_20220 [Acidobacteria bacterium]|nr:hypothetical protein [Acidobacteriota bacterium]